MKFGNIGGLANRNVFPEFRELWCGGPVISCRDMHQSFTGALVKSFFNNVPMFVDSFSVLSIHLVARELGASFRTSVQHRTVVSCDSTVFLYYTAILNK